MVQAFNRLLAAAKASQLISNEQDYRLERTTNGSLLHIKPSTGSTTAGGSVTAYHFATMFGDYYLTAEGVRVAKPYNLRASVTSEVGTDGTVYGFSYAPFGSAGGIGYIHRSKTTFSFGGYTEFQAIAPIYQAVIGTTKASEILATQVTNPTRIVTEAADTTVAVGTAITWFEIPSGRVWMKKVDQSQL